MFINQYPRSRRAEVNLNFNLLPQTATNVQFNTSLEASSNAGNIVNFTVTKNGGNAITYPAIGNASSFLDKYTTAGQYTYTAFATDVYGNKSEIITKTIKVVVDPVIQYIRHTLNTTGSIQNDSTLMFEIFYGSGPATGARKYSILDIPSGMTISKTTNIVDNEKLTMNLDSVIGGSKVITIRLTENGIVHDLPISLSILNPLALGGENEWHYITTRTKLFTPPVSGNYEIIGIGGGGAGGASSGPTDPMGHSSGGGGGSGILTIMNSVYLSTDKVYRINVGAGGAGGLRIAGQNGLKTTMVEDITNVTIFTAVGGTGGGLPTSNGSAAYGGNGGSGGGEGSVNGESSSSYGGNGGSGGNAGARAAGATKGSGSGQGTTLFTNLNTKGISISEGGRSLPPPGLTHPLYPTYPSLGVGEGGYGYGAGGGGGAGTCGSNNPGYGGGGAGGIHPAVIAPPKLASAGERAPGSHISSVGGSGASGYLRIKLIS